MSSTVLVCTYYSSVYVVCIHVHILIYDTHSYYKYMRIATADLNLPINMHGI